MTSHEFAHHILSMPDLPIVTPTVIQYNEGEDEEPTATKFEGEDYDGSPIEYILISYLPRP